MLKITPKKINSIIGHDLKDPLASISGIADILINDWDGFSSDEKFEIIQEIKESSDSAMRLLTDLLEWGKKTDEISMPEKKDFDTAQVIGAILDSYMLSLKRKKIWVDNQVSPGTIGNGDENMFAAIVRNLFANAVKSCLDGGKIAISAELSGSDYRFCISDNGIGMTKLRIDQLFSDSSQASGQVQSTGYNNGFGLILCRDFIKISHGKLWAESEEGQGTRVCFTFPASLGPESK